MYRYPTALLGLVLCLAQTIHAQEGPLPRPSISAEPGTVIPLGRPVTLQCRGPVGVYAFRLEREDRFEYKDNYNVFRLGPFESEARFLIDSVSEANAGLYRCIYYKTPRWSEHSDYLDLVVKETSGDTDSPVTEPDSSAGPTQRPLDNSHNDHVGLHHVSQDGLNLLTSWSFGLGLPKCSDYRREPPHPAAGLLFT
ncbi:leukocyte-associated immunoglobulin-like receptor 2 isoform X3 [Macaca fascicularis]|uniref:leukocyte-associated immunoglobulin-like receptor 2 isoform X3 n=1 Tax=Macaca fascicularis TaxID=9541 RepID=UPI0032B04B9A